MAVPLTSKSAYRDTREQKVEQLVGPRRHRRARPLTLPDRPMEIPGIDFVAAAGLEHASESRLRCGRSEGGQLTGKLQIPARAGQVGCRSAASLVSIQLSAALAIG